MNDFQENLPDTAARDATERHNEGMRQQGGLFVDAVRLTRMPMVVTDPTLPGNPITFANQAFVNLSGYPMDELLGQDPHFMNGPETSPDAIERYQAAMQLGRDENIEILQYRKDGTTFRAMLFASPLDDGQGKVTSHFLSYLDITRRHDAEEALRTLTHELEERIAARTEELESANHRLTDLLAERELLMMEVNHRAKNSLAVAASLLAMQGRRQTDEGVRILFDEAESRLNAMARVHDLLSKSQTSQRVDIAVYVTELSAALTSITEGDERISFDTRTEPGILIDADTAFPLGIIMTELITNAVKYAFPAPRTGAILTQARRGAPGRVELVIQDDGVGMSGVREGSLGFGLVRALVEQIQGDLDVQTDDGVAVTISFPVG